MKNNWWYQMNKNDVLSNHNNKTARSPELQI